MTKPASEEDSEMLEDLDSLDQVSDNLPDQFDIDELI